MSETSPLHLVCAMWGQGAIETVDLLLRAGASETAVGLQGNAPMDLVGEATDMADEQVVQRIHGLLRRAAADRVWRHRGWLVMLRIRTEQERRAQSIDDTTSSNGETKKSAGRLLEGGQGGDGSKSGRPRVEVEPRMGG